MNRKLISLSSAVLIALCAFFVCTTPVYAADDGNTGQDDVEGLDSAVRITYWTRFEGDDKKSFDKYFERNDDTAVVVYSIPEKEGIIWDDVFCGWSLLPGQTSPAAAQYYPGASIPTDQNLNLYAVWADYEEGNMLTASGNGTTWVYDGNPHKISGIEEKDDGRVASNGKCYDNGYFHQEGEDETFIYNYFYYTEFLYIFAEGTDAGAYSTPVSAFYFQSSEPGGGTPHQWNLVDDSVTKITRATMTITKAPLTIRAADQRAKYTGLDIIPEGSIEGLVTPSGKETETATLNMKPFKEVGVHPMEYTISWDGTAKKRNYMVSEEYLGDLTIYYELAFDANGGKDAPELMEVENDSTEIPSDVPKKDGYDFLGWATSQTAAKAEYQPGETIEIDDNTVLYAVWKDVRPNPEPAPTSYTPPKTGVE